MTRADTHDTHPSHRYTPALARGIESRWQELWESQDTFRAPNPGEPGFRADAAKLFILDMFPYPSGAGLHVGHPLGYIATDIVARFERMRGRNVLHAMGFDAFGLPAEQYAIETGTHPRITTERNIERFREQIRALGLGHERRRSVSTCDPDFYRWTQWIFLRLYDSWYDQRADRARPIADLITALDKGEIPTRDGRAWKELTADQRRDELDARRLAFLAEVPVNWCPRLGTVLANEEVTAEGRSERGNHPVFRRPLKQWMLRITAYSQRLLADLDALDWPEPIKLMQRNWIGRSEGAHVDFSTRVDGKAGPSFRVFTTRPDTLAGATYVVLAPEHPAVESLVPRAYDGSGQIVAAFPGAEALLGRGASPRELVDAYRAWARDRSDQARQEGKEKTGVFLGSHAVNPVTGQPIPIFIADYVLMGYGTGAIMAVPAHDDRDFEFATRFRLPIVDVVYAKPVLAMRYFCEHARDEERRDERWFGALADFLGLVTTLDAPPSRFAEVLETVRSRRQGDAAWTSCPIDATPTPPPDRPGAMGERRGGTRAVWMDAIEQLGVTSLADLRDRFQSRRFHVRSGGAFVGAGFAANSSNATLAIDDLPTPEAKRAMTEWLGAHGHGERAITYKLRDWLFSRQRYWGEPFPIVFDDRGRHHPVPESMLPVTLPDLRDYSPQASDDPDAPPRPPLGRAKEWISVTLDLGEGTRVYHRELNTMPNWAGSCWYYLRYLDPTNQRAMCAPEVERYWMKKDQTPGGVDLYVGGVEHAVLHLLYARFWHKVLFDLGHVSTPEPFQRLFNQGYIQAAAYTDARGVYVDASEVEETSGPVPMPGSLDTTRFLHKGTPVRREFGKMGKSLKNAVSPDQVCAEFGADTLRLYEMFMGPLEQSKPWNTRDITGVHRFLQRVWRLLISEETGASNLTDAPTPPEARRALHKAILGVTRDMESMAFNTVVSKLMDLMNQLGQQQVSAEIARPLVLMLAPLAPHVSEELWNRLFPAPDGRPRSIAREAYPVGDPSLAADDTIEIPVQVQGKVRARVTLPADADERAVEAAALADPRIVEVLAGRSVRKVIIVKGRMINIVPGE